MAQSGNDIADSLKDSFQKSVVNPVSSVTNAVGSAVDKAKSFLGMDTTPKSAPKVDPTWHKDMVQKANDSFKPKPSTPAPKKPAPAKPSYEKGTDYVPKTGPAILHKGEAVLNKHEAEKHREAKDMKKTYDVSDELGGKKEEKPKKEIDHIRTRKTKDGKYIHEHHHTHPSHPVEHHVSQDQDEMVDHMMQHMGEQNPGEAEADAGQSGIPGEDQSAVQPGAAQAAPAVQPAAQMAS